MTLTKEVVGVYPSYINPNAYSSMRLDLLSTIVWSSVQPNTDGSIKKDPNYPPLNLINYSHSKGVKVSLMVSGAAATIDAILSNTAIQSAFITNLLNEVQTNNFDGIDINFIFTTSINSLTSTLNNPLMTTFISNLSSRFRAANTNYRIGIYYPAVDWGKVFDVAAIQSNINYATIVAYDYHWTTGATSGSVAPIDFYTVNGPEPSVRNSINYYTGLMGAGKLLLGVAYFGIEWPTSSNARDAPATGYGIDISYSDISARAATYGRKFDTIWQTPFYTYQAGAQWYQGHYDDDQSLSIKYDLVLGKYLGGISIWSLSYDGSKPELWNVISTKFSTGPPPPTQTLTTISISPTVISLEIGSSQNLIAVCRDQNNANMSCPTLTWTSTNSAVATVDQSGKISGLSAGTSILYASASGINSNVITVSVQAVTGSILCSTSPLGAEIFIDGIDNKTKTPILISNVSPGSHIVTFKLSGYNDCTKTVSVSSGASVTASCTMTPVSSPKSNTGVFLVVGAAAVAAGLIYVVTKK